MVLDGRIHIEYKSTADMIADGLTQPLITTKFDGFVNGIGMKKIAEPEASRGVLWLARMDD